MNARPADRLAIALAQLNPTVGDVAGNADKARRARAEAAARRRRSGGVSRAVPLPAIRRRTWCSSRRSRPPAGAAIEELARETADGGPALLIGTPWVEDGKLYNAYGLLDGGAIAALRFKVDLPNYGVFDEKRVFAPGPMPGPMQFSRRAHRHSDLRGHLGAPRVVECLAETGGRNSAGAERLALLARQGRGAGSTSRWRASPKAACR